MNRFLFIMICVVSHIMAVAAPVGFMPVVSNYTQSAYPGGMQNWSVTQSASGLMWFGNQSGLMSFDGNRWESWQLPSRAVVRAVLADGDRVYVGSYTDFGYFSRDSIGGYVYHSLWPADYKAHNDEIWRIIKAGDGHVWFQSFCSWFDYDDKNKVTAHYDKDMLPLHFFPVGREVYAQMINGGLYRIKGARYVAVASRKDYGDDDIVAMQGMRGGALLCVTSRNGLYVLRGNSINHLTTEADPFLRSSQVNNAAMLGRSILVAGTILNGIYAVNLDTGRLLWHYNMANSLNNNTVLGLTTDRSGNVWAALDNGIALIHTGQPFTVMRTDRLDTPVGMVYGICERGNDMYIATNQALWLYDKRSGTISHVDNSNGQNWYVAAFGGQFLAGHNLSTLSLHGRTAVPVTGQTEGSTCIRAYHANGQDVLLEAGYNSLKIWRKEGGEWRFTNTVKGFSAPVLELETDNSGTIWAAHASKGIYKIELSPDFRRVAHVRFFGSPVPGGIQSRMRVMKIRGRVVFNYQDSLYTYDDIHGRIVPYEDIGGRFPKSCIAVSDVDNSTFWTADKDAFSLFGYDGKLFRRVACVPYRMFGLEVNTSGSPVYVHGGCAWFFLNNGIGRYRMDDGWRRPPVFPLTIARVTTVSRQNRTEYVGCAADGANIIHSDNISVVLSYPDYDGRLLTYRYRLKGNGHEMRRQQESPVLSFNSLGYGDYALDAEVLSPDGEVLARATYGFSRPVPWWLSVWALAAYAALAYIAFRRYVNWRTDRIVSRNRHAAEEELMRQNLKMLEQKQLIAAQQRIIMENELTVKSKELANMAFRMEVMRSHSEQMREELMEKKRKGKLTDKDFRELITKAEENDKAEMWELFRHNFDLIHQNFFRNLRSRYPELTPLDLKFCAMLRLNLNTKEIARHTNLTIRGVEGARYRLRKKLGIGKDQSLTEFLIDLK